MAAAVVAIRAKKHREAKLIDDVFSKYDADGSGEVDKDELESALEDLGVKVSAADLATIMRLHTKKGKDGIDRAKFYNIIKYYDTHWLFRPPLDPSKKSKAAWPHSDVAMRIYQHPVVVWLVAFLILFNFGVNIYEKEIDPYPAEMQLYSSTWSSFDVAFNLIFLVEIIVNIWSCGGPYRKFWMSGWNVFDFIVVAVGLLLMTPAVGSNSPLSNLKMLRAFRVFRLFKRIPSLNKVVMALLRAIPGVMNAFIIMVIFMCIYAILAVEYFAPLGQSFGEHPEGYYVTFGDYGVNHTIDASTARGFTYGWEYYGTFTRALYTLFQVMTGESWSEAVARPLMFGLYRNSIFVAIYFVSFILLTQIVLTNVVVAVLLDKFVDDPNAGGDSEEEERDKQPDEQPAETLESQEAGSRPATPMYGLSGSPTLSPPVAVVTPIGGVGSPAALPPPALPDAALTQILSELRELRAAVKRCEEGLSDLRAGGGGPGLRA